MYIPIKIGDITTRALADTGASFIFLSALLLAEIGESNVKKFEEAQNEFYSASGNVMKSFGRFEIELSIDGKHPVKRSFFVLSELKGNAILGLDFISKFNVVIDGQDRSFTFSSGNDQHKKIAEIETKTEPVCKSKFDGLTFGHLSKKQENELLNILKKFARSMVEVGSCDVVQYKVNLSTDRPIFIDPHFIGQLYLNDQYWKTWSMIYYVTM